MAIGGNARRRHGRRADCVPRSALRTAHLAVERAGRHHDHARQLRAGARGARPRADGPASRRRHAVARGSGRRRVPERDFRYPTAADVSLASLEGVARLDSLSADPILHDVSFRVEPGRMVAIVGPSGAGKTTIAGLVSRLYDPVGGIVRIGGMDLRDATTASVRDTVGVVSQDAHLFHETLRANLRYAKPDATDAELVRGVAGGTDLGCGRTAARRLGHRRRRSRPSAVGRREAADRHRPVAVEGPVDRRPRRGDRPPRLHLGVGGPARPRPRPGGTDVDRDRPPPRHGPGGRRDHRGRRRAGSSNGARTSSCSPSTACTRCSARPSSVMQSRRPPESAA